jgi:hypothetical protein
MILTIWTMVCLQYRSHHKKLYNEN